MFVKEAPLCYNGLEVDRMKFKMPDISKIYEAYGAIEDERIDLKEGSATVKSSDLSKEYTVVWEENIYKSNDNSSYWQGALGYPVIAVLMLQGKLTLNREVSKYFKGIPWKKLNTENKNKYDIVIEKILDDLAKGGIDVEAIKNEVSNVYKEIESLDISTKRSSLRPPR